MNKMSNQIVTRFAPSPTGKFHIGGVRTALYNYLFARKHGGKFILRCEDTDPIRSKREYEDYFLELFVWLGLHYDEYARQSERGAIYHQYLKKLLKENKAYISKEEQKKEGDRAEVIRFRNPNKIMTFHDEVLGDISVDTTDLGDFVIARDMESPLFHFTVVVDDFAMNITHVIRGQEHVSNTPRQILIQEAIGAPRPVYAHASIILNEKRAKLSKRDPLVVPALEYRDNGYLPEAILNFMALLGWNPGTDQEIFTLTELIDAFSIERMQKSGAIFNPDKLEWLNKEHIKRMEKDAQIAAIVKFLPEGIKKLSGYSENQLRNISGVIIERIGHFGDVQTMSDQGEISYYFQPPVFPKEKLFWKEDHDAQKLQERFHTALRLIEGVSESDFTPENVKNALWSYAEKEGRGKVLWPLRYALSGQDKSPDPFLLATLLGKQETIQRVKQAISLFNEE